MLLYSCWRKYNNSTFVAFNSEKEAARFVVEQLYNYLVEDAGNYNEQDTPAELIELKNIINTTYTFTLDIANKLIKSFEEYSMKVLYEYSLIHSLQDLKVLE